jgi:hypothetical protein
VDFRDYQGEYGPAAPNPPTVITSQDAGPDLFNFVGAAEFINGAVQLSGNGPPIILETDSWTKLFQVCFTIENLEANLDTFCPSIVWDLEQDPENGGFLSGDDGVVITVVDPDPNNESLPADENVVQFNWEYIGDGPPPFGQPVDLTCSNANCALPVASLTLHGTVEGRAHRIQWETLQDNEGVGFNVQRSINALDWKTLDFVPRSIGANPLEHYTYIDVSPKEGYNYYRLEQLNPDGTIHFSQIIQLTQGKAGIEPELLLYPNPVYGGELTLYYNGDLESGSIVQVYDPVGKMVIQAELPDTSVNLDVSALKSGVYFVVLKTTAHREVAKVIIQ